MMTAAGIATLVATLAGGYYGFYKASNRAATPDLYEAMDNYAKKAKKNGTFDDDLKAVFNDLVLTGQIDTKGMDVQKILEDAEAFMRNPSFWNNVKNTFNTKESNEFLIDFFNKAAQQDYSQIDFSKVKDFLESTASSKPVGSVAAPNYLDFNIGEKELPIHHAHLLSGQEMADMHGLNIDPQYYYDLIKQGTSANVTLQGFLDTQAQNASTYGELNARASYLDALRNNKSTAIAQGASSGAQAAQQILDAVSASKEFNDNYAEGVGNRLNAYENVVQADASAQLTANAYYNNLMNTIMNHAAGYYGADVGREGQDILTNADLFNADATLASIRNLVNQNMYADYLSAASEINKYNSQAGSQLDSLISLYNKALTKHDNNATSAWRDFQQTLIGSYANTNKYNNLVDYNHTLAQQDR